MLLKPGGPAARNRLASSLRLLLEALDYGFRADLRLVRVLAELAPGSPLPQQVPELVELYLDLLELRVVVGRHVAGFALFEQPVLLVHELADVIQHFSIVHLRVSFRFLQQV